MNARPVSIVMIEDDEGHARLIERNIRRAGVNNEITSFRNGTDGLTYLLGADGSGEESAQRSMLILLDLNLPRKSGRDVLAEIKVDPALRSIPVVILTTSSAEDDVRRSYDLHANCYIVKPYDYYSFVDAIQSIRHFWFSVATLPAEPGA